MKTRSGLSIMLSLLAAGALAALAQTTALQPMDVNEPAISLKEALSLAEHYVAEQKVDTSKHFMESVRLVYTRDNPKGGRKWIVTWALKTPSDGGQIFINVDLDKSVSVTRGL